MGGCRCTFRSCENSTALRPGMHFFHFPIRDWPRLEKWAINADKREFKLLPLSKLKNKVVCEEHFRNEMFMNYLKDSLTKMAVPTLDVLEDGRVWDLETNLVGEREQWIIPPNPKKSNAKREAVVVTKESDDTTMQIQFIDSDEDLQEGKHIAAPSTATQSLKLLNKEATNMGVFMPTESFSSQTPTILRKVQIKRKVSKVDEPVNPPKVQLLSIQKLPRRVSVREINIQPEETVQEQPAAALPSSSTDESPAADIQHIENFPISVGTVMDPVYLEKLEENSKQIAEVKKMLEDVLNRPIPEPRVITVEVPTQVLPPNPVDSGCDKLEKGPSLNKAQLFNGIKRYLNPTMVALLRMEMFGGTADRQWKPDEKALAVELAGLGENVYDHFCDEFRFRLPSKKDVQQWKEQELHDDDAS
ncbi:uncharacterized protein LOC128733011 [Sabethes cyaneus]|uniref:uncharacterized protein LOC128733011 n=1 Tax=Sabethes cyaneus TaxID=53552 RepID=UPI00237E5632|nr:uncharacterized protein LOC128733011 [Sabethes cyaneus]